MFTVHFLIVPSALSPLRSKLMTSVNSPPWINDFLVFSFIQRNKHFIRFLLVHKRFNFAASTPPSSGGLNYAAQATNTGSSPFAFAPAGGGTPSFGASSTPAANDELYGLLIGQFQSCRFTFFIYTKAAPPSVILSPLRPVFLRRRRRNAFVWC